MNLILWMLEPDVCQRATIFDLQYDAWTHQAVCIDQYNFHDVFSKDREFFIGLWMM